MQPRVLVLAVAAACAMLAVPAGSGAVAPTAGTAARAGGHHIDNWDRAEVSQAWRDRMESNLTTPSGWVGVAAEPLCEPGQPASAAQAATRESINFVRAMAGLDAVRFAGKLSRKAQKAALIMDANDSLSHHPPQSWDCWTEAGAKAAARSNLALTSGIMYAGGSVELYMNDAGPGNKAAGHRRWLLNPPAEKLGNGLTTSASAIYVLGPTDSTNRNPAWVSWPSPGWFPTQLQPGGRWSLSSGRSTADFSDARVRVTHAGKRLDVRRYKPVDGYAKPTLVFQVKGAGDPGTYKVVVRGIKGAAGRRHAYRVRLFRD